MKKNPRFFLFPFLFLYSVSVFAQQLGTSQRVRHFRITGNVSASTTTYRVTGIEPRRKPYSWLLNGFLNVNVYGISIPFSAVVSEQQRSFRQPFNQYGVSPRYKWITIHAGYRAIRFSDYTLAGVTFLGGGVELEPAFLRMSAIYGRFQKAVKEDSLASGLLIPAYKRMGYAFKIGLGSHTSFVDLILFKAKDDTASLQTAPLKSDVLPAENLILGLRPHLSFGRRVRFSGELAVSAFSRDIRAPEYDVSDNQLFRIFTNLFTFRTSSHANVAAKAELTINLSKFSLNVKYNRIDPDYQSLGAYYFNTDVESINLAPAFYFFNRKLNIATSIGRQRDNLNHQKSATTNRTIGSVDVSFTPSQHFSLNMQYGNYNTNQAAGIRPLNDTTRVKNISQNLMISPRVSFKSGGLNHMISLNFSLQRFTDKNPITSSSANSRSLTISPSYSLNILKAGFNLTVSGSNTNSEFGGIKSRISSANVAFGGRMAGNVITWSLSSNLAATYYNENLTNQVLSGNLLLSFVITKKNSLSLNINAINNAAKTISSRSFTEFTSNLTLSQRF